MNLKLAKLETLMAFLTEARKLMTQSQKVNLIFIQKQRDWHPGFKT